MVSKTFYIRRQNTVLTTVVNELSNTIDLDSTLIRAEALFRRFQRNVEAIDRKSNFPAPKLRQRPVKNASLRGGQSLRTSPPVSPGATANTSGTDTVTAGTTNSGSPAGSSTSPAPASSPMQNKEKGRASSSNATKDTGRKGSEMQDQRPKIISPELRELLSRKVEILPRKVVMKGGEGRSSLKK